MSIGAMKALFPLLMFLSACAGNSATQSNQEPDRWLTDQELEFFLPAGKKDELIAHLKAHPGEQFSQAACVTEKGKGKVCALMFCDINPEFDCWWENHNSLVRAEVKRSAEARKDAPAFSPFFLSSDWQDVYGEDPGKTHEMSCLRGIFYDDRVACITAYFDLRDSDRKKAEELLNRTCLRKGSFCTVDGKKIGKWKSLPKDSVSIRQDTTLVMDDGKKVRERYEYAEAR